MPDENTKTAPSAEISPPSTENPYDNKRYRNYVLFMLTMAYAFNFIDRQILVILQESIKQELLLSDAQLGLLTGIAFAFFYVMMGIPVARLADKWVRRNIMSIAISTWSFSPQLAALLKTILNYYSHASGLVWVNPAAVHQLIP